MRTKQMSGWRIAAVLQNKMILYAKDRTLFKEYNTGPFYIINLDYKNSLLRLKPTSNQEKMKELEKGIFKITLNFHNYIKIKAAFKGYHLKLVFKVGLSSKVNNNFWVFCYFLRKQFCLSYILIPISICYNYLKDTPSFKRNFVK